ncbi:MAG TPA: TerB family tellurite resistance protein [Stellaceae bacterium]|jgi:DnaJ like chaperone protein|nr:TerB family tellurite resistance protein [Stellaceae bacterium]
MSVISRIFLGATDWSHGGPIGALLDRAASHLPHLPHLHHERPADDPRRRVAFTIAVIALGAKMARADGEVTRDEVAAFGEVFQVPPGEEEHVRMIFDLARKSTHGFESYARQVGRLFAENKPVLEDLLGGLFHIALADGEVCAPEDQYLREVAHYFGFTSVEYTRIRALYVDAPEAADDPHHILGIDRDASHDEIRAAYHRLVRDNHPDLLMAQGLPPECIALANSRVARINAAHDRLVKG